MLLERKKQRSSKTKINKIVNHSRKIPILFARTLGQNLLRVFVVLAVFGLLTTVYTYTRGYLRTQHAQAATGINHQINFQGKLVNPDGTNVTDGSYTIVFSIYNVASGGSSIWTETQSVPVSRGIFQVNLGSVVADSLTAVNFNDNSIYLGIKVGSDAEMTPRIQFTAVPQAFNSEKLGGLDKSGFIQNSTSLQSASNFYIQSNNASSVTAKFRAVSSQTADVIQVRDSGDTTTVFAVSPAGTITAGTWNGSALTDAYVSDTLTSSIFIGSGSTTNAIDLATAEVAGTLGASNGGTGLASYTVGDLLYASGTTSLGKLASVATGSCLISQGVGVAPVWGACTSGSLTSLTLAGTSGSNQTISNGDTITIAAGNNITTTGGATDTITVATVNNPSFSTSVSTPILTATGALAINSGANGDITINANGTGTLQVSDASTFASTVTLNGALTANDNVTFNFSGTENATINSDLAGSVNILRVTGTPSATAGTTRGLFVQQADSANSNGLDTALYVDNADTNLAITNGLQITNSGGGGYTNYISAPSFVVDGTGTITSGIWNGTALTDTFVSNTLTASILIGTGSTTNAVDLGTAEVSGTLGISNGGTGATSLNDLIALGTHTTGNYVANNTAGTGIAVTGTAGEGWSPTISLDYSATLAGNPALSANQSSFASTGLIFEGSTANTNELLLTSADPGADVTLTLPAVTGTIISTGNITDITGLTDGQISDTLTASNVVGSGSTSNAVDLGTAEVNGTLGVGNGGTGITSYTAGDLLYASSGSTLGKLAAVSSGSCLISQGTGTAPAWGSCGLTSEADTLATVTARGATTSTNTTFNGTLTANNSVNFGFTGTQKLSVTSDLNGSSNTIDLKVTPSNTAGTNRGLFIQQNDGGTATNGLNAGVYINNAEADLAIVNAIQITNSGGGGYTNLISAPSFVLNGSGVITTGTWNGTALTDAYVSDTLTASNFVGSGSTTNAVDLATAEVAGTLGVSNGGTGATSLNNLITLGTHTTGNYSAGNTAGTGIAVTGTAGEGWSPTVSLDYSATLASNPTFTASQSSFASTGLIFEGSTADTNELLLIAADPGSDVTLTLPNVTGTIISTGNISAITGLTDSQVSDSLTVDWTGLQNYPAACSAGQAVTALADTPTCTAFLTSFTEADTLATVTGRGATTSSNLTFNGTLDVTGDSTFTFSGNENLAINSDLDAGVNLIQVVGTPSATSGATRGLFVQQADSANTNGLDQGIYINNADTDLAITTGIQFANSGGGGYTNYISAPSFTLDGTGTITAGTWNGTALTDAYVSNTLTASILIGSGSTTNNVDLGTGEVAGTLGVGNGGTGITSYTVGDLLYASGASTLSKLAAVASGSCLISQGTGTAPAWGSCGLASEADTLATVTGRGATTSSNLTFNGTLDVTKDTTYTFAGNDNLAVNSDLNAGVNLIQVVGTPSATSGVTRGLFIQQADSANTNGLDIGIRIDNADTDMAVNTAIQIANSGGGGYTNILTAPSFTLDGTGTITAGTWNGTALTDAFVSNTLTASILIGTGSTTNNVDLGTGEVAGTLGVANGGTGATSLNDLIALGSNTTGNYVASVTASANSGIAITGSAGEGWTPSISLDYSAAIGSDPTLSANQVVFGSTGLIFEGSTANVIETLLTAANPAGSDVTLTLPNITGTLIGTGNISDITGLVDSQISDTLTASILIGSGSTTNAVDLGTNEVAGTLGVGNGGTGITSYTIGDLLYASGTSALSKLAAVASGSCLKSQGTGTAPAWGSCGLASEADTLATVTGRGATTSTNTTFNGTLTVNNSVNFGFTGTQKLSVTSDLNGSSNTVDIKVTPSSTAGTNRGLFIQQNDDGAAGGTNGLNAGVYINNAEADLVVTNAIQIASSGAAGYTNLINTPSFKVNGSGAISGATGLSSSGTISLGGTAASSLTTTTGALTLTGAAASTWSTSAGALTLQAATTLNLGTATTTGVSISRTGVATTINGSLTVTQAATLSSTLTVSSTATFNGDLMVSSASNLAYTLGTNITTTGTINNMCVGPGSFFKFTGAGAVTLTGLTGAIGCGTHGSSGSSSTGATDGRMITFINGTGNSLTVKANSGSSAVGNKIFTGTGGADLVIRNGGTFQIIYDSNSSGWRTLGDGADTGCTNCAALNLGNVTGITSSLIPNSDNSIDLGSASNRWRDIYSTTLTVKDNHANGNPIATITNSNNDDNVNRDILHLDFSNQTCNGYTDNFHHYIVFQSGGVAMGGVQAMSGANVDCTNGAHIFYDTDGGDYAEYFLTDINNKPSAHELVSFKDNAQNNVTERAINPSLPIIGAVSTNAGFVGNSTNCPIDEIVECKTKYSELNSLVALVGQVEVKVNNSNGAIKVGDPIGLSTTPGVGSKLIGSGYIVGYAMEKLDAASGEIMVVIRPSYFTAPTGDVLQGSSLAVTGDATISGSLAVGDDLNVSGATTLNSLTVTGNATVQGDLTVVGSIETRNITVNGHIITAGGVPTVTAGSGAGVASGAVSAPLVEVIGNDTSGTITITAGADGLADVLANIDFAQDFGSKPHVMLTAANRDATKLGIYYDAASASNSKVKLMTDIAPEAGKTYVFSYLIVQ
jgi:hypothetical protein